MKWENIQGFFNYAALYDRVVKEVPQSAIFVEVGNWHGRSLCYLATKVRESKKKIEVVGVDWGYDNFRKQHTALVLASNIIALNLSDIVTQITCPSVKAARFFADKSLDFVFIDADHTYKAVTEDIKAWLPKVKPGGLLAGHDYQPAEKYGVNKAVRDYFKRDCQSPTSETCWEYRL